LLVAAGALAGGCRGAASQDAGASVTVSAASSLRDAFSELGAVAEGEGLDVTFNFDSSSSLAAQIIEGAPADVYASAAPEDMARLEDAGLVRDPVPFARNVLAIVTPPGNPRRIASLADLAGVGVVSLCGPDVPCGRYAQRALEAAGVALPESSVTRGQNAAAALTAVAAGDAAAGVVYATDARAAGDEVVTVPISGADELAATYLVGALDGSPDAASAFVDLIGSEQGQEVLQEHGFLPVV
jgi:molybdate transport system substrate-binding protein